MNGSSRTGALKSVRQGQQNRRGRGRATTTTTTQGPTTIRCRAASNSNGPDVKIRGTPAHIAEKYISLARDAQSTGDPVLAENYLQHAEHYSRIIMAYREQLNQPGEGATAAASACAGRATWARASTSSATIGDLGGEDGFAQPSCRRASAAAAASAGRRRASAARSVTDQPDRQDQPGRTGRSGATRTGPAMRERGERQGSPSATASRRTAEPQERAPSRRSARRSRRRGRRPSRGAATASSSRTSSRSFCAARCAGRAAARTGSPEQERADRRVTRTSARSPA